MADSFVPDRFAGKTTIVTGAGSGIGRATAVRLIQEGARVVATDVVESRLQELEAELHSDRLVTVAGDVISDGSPPRRTAAPQPLGWTRGSSDAPVGTPPCLYSR